MSTVRDTRVLVIGGLGFIGLNLTSRLLDDGARVTVMTPSRERHEAQARVFESRGAKIVEGDVRDPHVVAGVAADPAIVFNLSGQSGAVRSMEDPWTDIDVNLRGTLVLLEALREKNAGATLVVAGSRLQYGRAESMPVSENDHASPLCLHGVHKQTVEEYLRLYSHLFGLKYAVARVTNPYGPGQPAGRTAYGVINRMIHLALADQALTVYGDGAQLRDYVHVDDVAGALMLLATSKAANGRAYNVGSGTGTSLTDLAKMVVSMAGRGRVEHIEWPALAAQIETGDFVADVSRIKNELGWSPRVALKEGLAQTIQHYRGHLSS